VLVGRLQQARQRDSPLAKRLLALHSPHLLHPSPQQQHSLAGVPLRPKATATRQHRQKHLDRLVVLGLTRLLSWTPQCKPYWKAYLGRASTGCWSSQRPLLALFSVTLMAVLMTVPL